MVVVAAYASLLSLFHVLDRIQHPCWHRVIPDMLQIKTLQNQVGYLQETLEIHSNSQQDFARQIAEVDYEADSQQENYQIDDQIEDFVRQIAEVAYEAEFIIHSHVVDQLRGGSEEETVVMGLSSSFCQDLDKVIEKIDSIKKQLLLTMAKENSVVQGQQSKVSVAAGPSRLPFSGKNTHVVGFDEDLVRIMDQLTRDEPNLQIIPIVGMGGIGKTTLARIVFENEYIVERFDVRVWFIISQEYSVREILLGVLRDIGGHVDVNSESTLAGLGQQLHKKLFGRRYLVVMDDLWSTKGWDDFKLYFPDNGNGSGIMVTTRLTDVAVSLASYNPYSMNFLDENKSWDLLCEKAFIQGSCSPELEEIGKKIARSCRGLPLAIVVIGGLLGKSNMTREYWEFVAGNLNLFANSEGLFLKILDFCYHHLPIHLKPCFLYMRIFPEDYEIQVAKLTCLWIAEGLLKPSRAKNLEEVAEEYLKDLIDRNLILIRKKGSTGKIKTCAIHDLLRNFCFPRKSLKEHVFGVPKVQHNDFKTREKSMCFVCSDVYMREKIQLGEVTLGSRSSSLVSHWLCNACSIMDPQLIRKRFVNGMLVDMPIEGFPQPTTLRYLTVKDITDYNFVSFSSIDLFWNLQTLVIEGDLHQPIVLPDAIWEMPELRYIKIDLAFLPHPVDIQMERKNCTILENLHTLSNRVNFRFTEEVLKMIPNIKKLRITYFDYSREDWSYYSLNNLAHLSKLESLSLWAKIVSLEIIVFPHSLKKLVLDGCRMHWEDMTIIGSLPNLEMLKLGSGAFEGPEWNPVEGEFLRLKFLSIGLSNLVGWRAENIHFPCLETLVLRWLKSLEEIPLGIGKIATLRSIDLTYCSNSAVDSAMEIIFEHSDMGYEKVEVHVTDGNGRRRL